MLKQSSSMTNLTFIGVKSITLIKCKVLYAKCPFSCPETQMTSLEVIDDIKKWTII